MGTAWRLPSGTTPFPAPATQPGVAEGPGGWAGRRDQEEAGGQRRQEGQEALRWAGLPKAGPGWAPTTFGGWRQRGGRERTADLQAGASGKVSCGGSLNKRGS